MERFVWICLAGAVGTGTRYLVALWAGQRFGSAFPFGTLIVNLAGCFAIAAAMHTAAALSWSPTARSAVTIGFIGGLTTYSSFNYETTRLLEEGATGAAMFNAGATIVGAFLAGLMGMLCARLLVGR
jgi:fluoride exporter